MNVKILKVFYGTDTLPYKDKARTIHFPIVGQSFIGASNTTEIRFYFEQLGDSGANATYIASAKLPNGKKGYKLLTKVYDSEENEWYAKLQLSSFFTQAKGDLYISLRGYDGGAEIIYDSLAEIYKVEGDPIIQGTGSIKLAINYAVEYQQGSDDEEISLEDIYAEIGTKLAILSNDYMSIVDDISAFVGTSDFADYPNNHIFLDRATKKFYQKLTDSTYQLYDFSNYYYEADASTTFSELANLGHAIFVKYQYYNYLMFAWEPTSNVYVFTIYNLGIAGEVFASGFGGAYIESDVLFSSILTNQYKINFVEQTNVPNIVYGTDNSGNQAAISVSVNVANSTIVRRGASGQIYARETPTENTEVVRKEYVDSFAKDLEVNIDPTTFEMTFTLKDKNGNVLAEEEIDLPLESIIVSAEYYETYTYDETTYEKVLVIELATTDIPTIIPVGDLLDGLVNEEDLEDAVADLQTKIDKCVQQKTTTGNYAYTHNGSTEGETKLDSSATANTIPIRDNSGNIQVGTPVNSGDATKKAYVDTFARTLECAINPTTYIMTFTLKDNGGNTISTQTIDLPLETMVVDGSYDSETESLVLELKNGSTISIPISDLISGLITNSDLATALASYYTKAQIDQMVAGFVFADVDDELSEVSDNPVENRVITIALDKKANVDGNYPTMTVGVADQLSPYDDESGDDQDEPFSFQATGTGNGSQPDFSTGAIALMKEKQGNTVVVNQLVKNPTFDGTTDWYNENSSFTVSNNVATFTANAQNGNINTQNMKAKSGDKLLFSCDIKLTTPTTSVQAGPKTQYTRTVATTNWQNIISITNAVPNDAGVVFAWVQDTRASDWDEIQVKNVILINLTQWFNGDIPQDLLDNPENFYRYYQGSLAYNTGELVNADGRYIKCIGRQQWDEDWELGTIDADGNNYASNNNIRSKNYIKVLNGATYHVKSPSGVQIFEYDINKNYVARNFVTNSTITLSKNTEFIRFRSPDGTTTYGNNICISIYYEDESGYDQYYPYEVLTNNDTGTEVLRSAGSVKDYKEPDGTIHRLVGSVDLSQLDSQYVVFNEGFNSWQVFLGSAGLPKGKFDGNYAIPNMISSTGRSVTYYYGDKSNSMVIRDNGNLLVGNGSSTTPPTDIIYYELAEPTTEQGTSYSENLVIDDFGSMDFQGTNGVPQGNLIFYPVDYKAFIDTLYDYTEGTPSNIALKSDLPTALQTWAESLPGYDASATQLLKNVEGTLTWITEGE